MTKMDRREFIATWLAVPASAALALPLSKVHAMSDSTPTNTCPGLGRATREQTEGPFFTPNTPLKSNFRADDPDAAPFSLLGFVVDSKCAPLPGAMVELWHANTKGDYDNNGYLLRGHVFTDKDGRFVIETGLPGKYPGRTRHFHIKVLAEGERSLTTQLYFPADKNTNESDWLYKESLLMDTTTTSDGQIGRYNFVL